MNNEDYGDYVAASDATEETETSQPVEEPVDLDDEDSGDADTVSKSEYEKALELANNYKIRAEKAERRAKEIKDAPATQPAELTQSDLIALIRADVPEEDIAEVVDFAKLKNIPVREALKSNVVKAILDDRKETRTTAEATSTQTARRAPSKATDDTLLANAAKGLLPDSDADLQRLVAARMKRN